MDASSSIKEEARSRRISKKNVREEKPQQRQHVNPQGNTRYSFEAWQLSEREREGERGMGMAHDIKEVRM